jgi:hypothetical protein
MLYKSIGRHVAVLFILVLALFKNESTAATVYDFETSTQNWTGQGTMYNPWPVTEWSSRGNSSLKADIQLQNNAHYTLKLTQNQNLTNTKAIKATARRSSWGTWSRFTAKFYIKTGDNWQWYDGGLVNISDAVSGQELSFDISSISTRNYTKEIGIEFQTWGDCNGKGALYLDNVRYEEEIAPVTIDYPAELFFGTISFNDQLADNPNGWSFAREHIDGMIIHPNHTHPATKEYSYYRNNLGIRMSNLLTGKKVIAELGMYLNDSAKISPLLKDPNFSNTQATKAADHIRKIKNDFGITTSEWNWVAWCNNPRTLYQLFPQVNSIDDAMAVLTKKPASFNKSGLWQEYHYNVIKEFRRQLPGHTVWFNMPPVYYDMQYNGVTYPAVRDYGQFAPDIHLSGADYYKAYSDAGFAAQGTHGYSADYPFRFWLEDETGTEKIVSVCKYHHDIGAKYSQIMIGDGYETDAEWYDRSMSALRRFQLYGGRADRYLFQSWKINGPPYTLVPETGNEKTFMMLIKDALIYLKGCDSNSKLDLYITDDATGLSYGRGVYMSKPSGVQQHNLQLRKGETKRFTISFINRHPLITILPVLKAIETNNNGYSIRYLNNTTTINDTIISKQGWPYRPFIPRTSIRSITVEIKNVSAVSGSIGRCGIYALWNPQDPTGQIRDALELVFTGL